MGEDGIKKQEKKEIAPEFNDEDSSKVKENAGKKYELTDESIEVEGMTFYRVRALRDIALYRVKAGDFGGYIESEDNLSQEGECWIGKNTKIARKARVIGNSWAGGESFIYGAYNLKTEVLKDKQESGIEPKVDKTDSPAP